MIPTIINKLEFVSKLEFRSKNCSDLEELSEEHNKTPKCLNLKVKERDERKCLL